MLTDRYITVKLYGQPRTSTTTGTLEQPIICTMYCFAGGRFIEWKIADRPICGTLVA